MNIKKTFGTVLGCAALLTGTAFAQNGAHLDGPQSMPYGNQAPAQSFFQPYPQRGYGFFDMTLGGMVDLEAFYTGFKGGYTFPSNKPKFRSSIFGELGFFSTTETWAAEDDYGLYFYDVTLSGVTLSANYRASYQFNQIVGVYGGAGAGCAFLSLDVDDGYYSSYGYNVADETVGFFQAFGGVSFNVSQRSQITVGARWISFAEGDSFDLGDDILIEAGWKFNF